MKYIIITFLLSVSLFGIVFSVQAANSIKDNAVKQLKTGAQYAGYGENPADPRIVASRLINIFLGFVGAIFTYLFVYSGYLMITSHGEEEKISKARKTMQGAVIGILLTLMSFSIAYFVGRKSKDTIGIEDSVSCVNNFYI